ncbi:helix-turn-helix domain-containing protein [Nocardiopsis suaedae]|uniref:Helix-turn-helix transcriptional regulator n=1 Tax=Nocardiopsis suaedae TaxID=3018444 RepID=A0ABT4TJB2_9ACTN|nr:helix-turn-helix transcriptional regulator [Nocardiopsis suaedae]MDA2804761.1 helix-turn-helix transcriptional regulator [Nocardiopsis suaedae]
MASSPPLRRRRLSRHLRELREAQGYTAEYVTAEAKKTGIGRWSRGKLTRIENNEWTRPSPKDVEVLLDIYGVTDEAERDSFIALTKQARQRGWWVGYSDVLGKGAYVGLEIEASRIRTYEALVIPGLLQTEAYARAATRAAGVTAEDEVDRHVEARMLRKQILGRPESPRIWAIIDEAALHRLPSELRDEQIRYLLDVQRPELRIQVLPYSAGLHAATAGSFVILDFKEDPQVVYREDILSSLFYEDPREIERCEMIYDHVHASALSVEDSRAFLETLIEP